MSRKVWLLVAIGVPLVSLTAAFIFWKANRPLTIADVVERCTTDQPVDVRVAGRVAQVQEVPFVEVSVYRLVDDMESIWVLTRRPAPRQDREMVVVGTATPTARFKSRCLDFLEDEDICEVAGKVVRFVAGSCVLFEDRRE